MITWIPEVNRCKFSAIVLASGSQKLIKELVRLLGKKSVCHVQLVRLIWLAECLLNVSECHMKVTFVFFLFHVTEVQHGAHLWLGLAASAEESHRQGNRDAQRRHEDVVARGRSVKLVQLESKLCVGGRQMPTMLGVLKDGFLRWSRHLVNIQSIEPIYIE